MKKKIKLGNKWGKSKRAGHSSISVTHNTYSHFFVSEFKKCADEMEDFLKKLINKNKSIKGLILNYMFLHLLYCNIYQVFH